MSLGAGLSGPHVEVKRHDPVEQQVASIWRRRLAWSGAADRLKARITRARATTLILTIAGAVLATAAATVLRGSKLSVPSAVLGAATLAIASYVTSRVLTSEAIRAWTRARSVSEAIKAEVWKLRASVEPYVGPEAPRRLNEEVHRIEKQALDLERHLAEVELPSGSRPPPAMSPAEWINNRVIEQSEGYYRPSARQLARRLRTLRGVEIALGLFATAASAIVAWFTGQKDQVPQSIGIGVGQWVAVLTTIGGSLTAHIAANRYDFLVMSYYATARRLDQLLEDWRALGAPNDPARWSEFVHNCEAAISIENEGWLAKSAQEKPEERKAEA